QSRGVELIDRVQKGCSGFLLFSEVHDWFAPLCARDTPAHPEPQAKRVPQHSEEGHRRKIVGTASEEQFFGLEAEEQAAGGPVHTDVNDAVLACGDDVAEVAVERIDAKDR